MLPIFMEHKMTWNADTNTSSLYSRSSWLECKNREVHWKPRVVMMPTLPSVGSTAGCRYRQPVVPPVTAKLASWQNSVFCVTLISRHLGKHAVRCRYRSKVIKSESNPCWQRWLDSALILAQYGVFTTALPRARILRLITSPALVVKSNTQIESTSSYTTQRKMSFMYVRTWGFNINILRNVPRLLHNITLSMPM